MNVYELLFYNLSCFCHGAAKLCTSSSLPLDLYLAWEFWQQTDCIEAQVWIFRWIKLIWDSLNPCYCQRFSNQHRTRRKHFSVSLSIQETKQQQGTEVFFLFMLTIIGSFRTWFSDTIYTSDVINWRDLRDNHTKKLFSSRCKWGLYAKFKSCDIYSQLFCSHLDMYHHKSRISSPIHTQSNSQYWLLHSYSAVLVQEPELNWQPFCKHDAELSVFCRQTEL